MNTGRNGIPLTCTTSRMLTHDFVNSIEKTATEWQQE
jgi:hypothetical protein